MVSICGICGHIAFKEAPDNCPICFAPKDKFIENNKVFEESKEKSPEGAGKHTPSIKVDKSCGLIPEESCTDVHMRVGEVLHPMTSEHYIMFADFYLDDVCIQRVHYFPDKTNAASAVHMKVNSGKVKVVQKCNLHGYWMSEVSL